FSPVFGLQNHAEAAVRASLGMRAAVAEFNRVGGFEPVAFGVGLHRGRVIAGKVGTEDRHEYTVLGDVVNVASRIENQTKETDTDILLSAEVLAGLDPAQFSGVKFEYCGPVLLRGKIDAIELYRPVGIVPEF